ncbi:MAG: adenine deaminase [Kiritimatiellae bacterium]|nr:adenine deaminase [Clostridia bacterium]MBP5510830.1 adenine deaminase [Kiritimatiellia bacterium]
MKPIEPFSVSGKIVDVERDCTISVRVSVSSEGKIAAIDEIDDPDPGYIFPGFVDSHVHLESSMLNPVSFAFAAVRHGTLGVLADPHEIANVLGETGVRKMIELADQTPFVFGFGVPSCVPATENEKGGGELGAEEVKRMLKWKGITHLSEVMDVNGVLEKNEKILKKISYAKESGKPIDGHAPGMTGTTLRNYIASGISTDHESVSVEEAIEKIRGGMVIQIRNGSAARLSESLLPLVSRYTRMCMFCSDDKHPDDLLDSHINFLAARAYRNGVSLSSIVQAACINPVRHYGLPLGLLKVGDSADFQKVEDLRTFDPSCVWLHGREVYKDGQPFLPETASENVVENQFEATPIVARDLSVSAVQGMKGIHVIGVRDGILLTNNLSEKPTIVDGEIVGDTERDILKIVVMNRYRKEAKPAVAFVKGFGLKRGALASSVCHDAHNLIAVGTNDEAITAALNQIIWMKGGLTVADSNRKIITSLPLPFGGLMSNERPSVVARRYKDCDKLAKMFGSPLSAPFTTLSFMALPVIPDLKMTSRGLFDVRQNQVIGLRSE